MKKNLLAALAATFLLAGLPAMAQDTNVNASADASVTLPTAPNTSPGTGGVTSGATLTPGVDADGDVMTGTDATNAEIGLTTEPAIGTVDATTGATTETETMTGTTTESTTETTTESTTTDVGVTTTPGERVITEEERTTVTTTTEPVYEESTTTTTTTTPDEMDVTTDTTTTTTTETSTWGDTDASAGETRDAAMDADAGVYDAEADMNGANRYYRTGGNPGLLTLLGSGLVAGSLMLRGRRRQRS